MAWRYKTSKFKNTAPNLPKKEDTIYDLPVSYVTSNNNGIAAGTQFIAFHIDAEGGKLGVLPVSAKGRHCRTELSVVCAHGADVADFAFMPFGHDLLVTCARDDDMVKVWNLNDHKDEGWFTTGEATREIPLNDNGMGGSVLAPHSTAANILAAASAGSSVHVLDIEHSRSNTVLTGLCSRAQSMSWNENGSNLAVISQQQNGQEVAVFDVRAGIDPVSTFATHEGSCRESRIVYLNGTGKLLTSGFNEVRRRVQEVQIFNESSLTSGSVCRQEFDASTGVLMPLYDADTRLLFFVGKGSKSMTTMEVLEQEVLGSILGMVNNDTVFGQQSLGACLTPKSCMDVMQGEVQRVWQLAKAQILPVPCIVPRRTYRNFIPDLYPHTTGQVAGCTADQWWNEKSTDLPPRFSLNPTDASAFNETPAAAAAAPSKPAPRTTTAASAKGVLLQSNNVVTPPISAPTKADADNRPDNMIAETPASAYSTPMTSVKAPTKTQPDPYDGQTPTAKLKTTAAARNIALNHRSTDDEFELPAAQNQRKVSFGHATLIVSPTSADADRSLPLNDSLAEAELVARSHSPCRTRTPTPPPEEEQDDQTNAQHNTSADSTLSNGESSPPRRASVRDSIQLFDSPRRSDDDSGSEVSPVKPLANSTRNSHNISAISHASELDDSFGPLPFTEDKPKPAVTAEPVKRRGRASMDHRERPVSQLLGVGATSKFRHCEVKPGGKEEIFTGLRQVHTGLPLECDGLQISSLYAAVALTGPGGLIQIHKLASPSKVEPGVLYGVENGALVTDYRWSPHHPDMLAVGCANGIVNIWRIPDGGIKDETLREPYKIIKAESGKIVNVRWHPSADGLVLVSTSAHSIMLFDVSKPDSPALTIMPHPQHLHSLCWSAGGRRLATISADGILRLFDPRLTQEPTKSAKVLEKTRAARILFACDDRIIIIVHFKGCDRKLSLFDSGSLAELTSLVVDRTSSQLLIPQFDQDSCVLMLTAKGDRTLHIYEVRAEAPHLLPCTPYQAPTAHQSIHMHQKNMCDIRNVEFARAWRLTKDTLEPLYFRVPRVNKDLFANDIFPDALVTWRAAMSGADWLNGAECKVVYESLRPDGMQNAMDLTLNSTNNTTTTAKKSKQNGHQNGNNENGHDIECNNNTSDLITNGHSLKPGNKQVANSLAARIEQLGRGGHIRESLEQDHMEGVDEHEWDD